MREKIQEMRIAVNPVFPKVIFSQDKENNRKCENHIPKIKDQMLLKFNINIIPQFSFKSYALGKWCSYIH